jgi:hypothetical protein
MKEFLFGLSLFPLAVCAVNIEGVYDVTGWDPYENQAYAGTAKIKQDKNDVFQISWNIDNGTQFQGTGLIVGNTFSAVFRQSQPPSPDAGLQTFTIAEEALRGAWLFLNHSLVGNETLTKRKKE